MERDGTKVGTRRKWSETEARASLAAWKRSGETEFAFARRQGFSPQRLRYWRDRLGAPGTQDPVSPAFVAVSMPIVAVEAPKIVIHIGAVSVCVREDLDADHLARIVGALAHVRTC